MEYHKSCKTLPLKLFFEIAETGNVKLLGEGEIVELTDVWESILLEYSELDNNMAINNILDLEEEQFKQMALYCEIKAMLLYLVGAFNQEFIDRLNQLGYKVDKDNLVEDIKRNNQKSNNIFTRVKMIKADIKNLTSGKKSSFDKEMSFIATRLGFEPKEEITVARYVEYKNRIEETKKK